LEKTKKILLLIDNLGSGGAQNQIVLLALALKSVGYEPIVFTYFPQDFFKNKLIRANIEVIYEAKQGKIGWNVVHKIQQIITKESIATVISYLETPNFYAALIKSFFHREVKLITSYRSKTNLATLSWVHSAKLRWTNKQADFIVANSNHEREFWQSYQPAIAQKWKTIYNTIDRVIFHKIDVEKEKKLLVVGSVSADKNGLLVIEALNILKQQNCIVQLNWYGEKIYHIPERKAYLEAMEAKINQYGLVNQWFWQKPTTQLNQIYNEHYALILASEIEGLPNVVCEAMSCALPCLVSKVLDHHLLIKENKSGYLFSPQSAAELAEAIKKLYALNQTAYDEMCQQSQQQSQLLFSPENFLVAYQSLIEC
jgi:glycosyltransferase involved in cell wall biosynthesis